MIERNVCLQQVGLFTLVQLMRSRGYFTQNSKKKKKKLNETCLFALLSPGFKSQHLTRNREPKYITSQTRFAPVVGTKMPRDGFKPVFKKTVALH